MLFNSCHYLPKNIQNISLTGNDNIMQFIRIHFKVLKFHKYELRSNN